MELIEIKMSNEELMAVMHLLRKRYKKSKKVVDSTLVTLALREVAKSQMVAESIGYNANPDPIADFAAVVDASHQA